MGVTHTPNHILKNIKCEENVYSVLVGKFYFTIEFTLIVWKYSFSTFYVADKIQNNKSWKDVTETSDLF